MSESDSKTILVIDDSDLLLQLAQFQLEDSGFSVLTSLDVAGARRLMSEHPPDLVILDVEMPNSDPKSLIASMSPGVVVWLFSALDEPVLAERAVACGADGYVCKTDGFGELVRRARALFSSS